MSALQVESSFEVVSLSGALVCCLASVFPGGEGRKHGPFQNFLHTRGLRKKPSRAAYSGGSSWGRGRRPFFGAGLVGGGFFFSSSASPAPVLVEDGVIAGGAGCSVLCAPPSVPSWIRKDPLDSFLTHLGLFMCILLLLGS